MDETRREPALNDAGASVAERQDHAVPQDEAQARREAKRAAAVRRAKLEKRRAAQRRSSHNVLLAALLLLTILVVGVANLAGKDRSFSESENRNLAQKPQFSWTSLADGSWFAGLTDWYSDQFFGRDRWISMHLWETRRLGQKESGGVWLGKDGYLLSPAEAPDTEALARTVETMNRFALDHPDLNQWILLAPNAASVLTDKLPKNAPSRDQLPDIDAAEAQISVQPLDAVSPLLAHTEEEIYYHTDHHWTQLGAYYAYEAFCQTAGFEPVPLSEYEEVNMGLFTGSWYYSVNNKKLKQDEMIAYIPPGDLTMEVSGHGVREGVIVDNTELLSNTKNDCFISGDNDPVGQMSKGVLKVANQFKNAGLKDVTVKLYHNARHELLNEMNRDEVMADLSAWLDQVMRKIY